jgi:hypothetical protein
MSGEISNNAAPGSGSETVKGNNVSTVLGNFALSQAVVSNSLDTQTDIDNFFVEGNEGDAKVEPVSTPSAEGSGSFRTDQPSQTVANNEYGGNTFLGTTTQHSFADRPEYPNDGLNEAHIRFYAYLDTNYEIDNPFDGEQAGKGFPGFNGKWGDSAGSGGDPSDGTNGWSARGAIHDGRPIGGTADEWCMPFYVYYADQSGDYGDTFFPDNGEVLQKGQWYQIDRYLKMNSGQNTNDGILRQWQDGKLVIDKTNLNFAWTSPYDKIESVWNHFYYGGGWGTPDGSGHNYAYIDNIRVYDEENAP